jgi:hypothetical protein
MKGRWTDVWHTSLYSALLSLGGLRWWIVVLLVTLPIVGVLGIAWTALRGGSQKISLRMLGCHVEIEGAIRSRSRVHRTKSESKERERPP